MNLSLPPVLDRELRVAARSPHTYSLRLSMALGAAVVSGFMFWVMNEMGLVAGGGGGFFRVMANVAYAYCLASGAALTIDCLSEEKRNGTLGLLFLTRLKSGDIVLGKLFACALRSLYGLLAALPVLSVCLMLGGVTYGEFGRVAISLLNALFFSLSAGMLASALCVNPVRASLLGTGLILGSGMILPVAATLLREEFNRPDLALALEFSSPYCGLRLAWDGVSAWERMIYWQSLPASFLVNLLFLWMASRFLDRAWQDKPVAGDAGWRARWRQWNVGAGEARWMHRQRLLAINPIYWLGSRERFGTAGLWVWIVFIYALGLFAWLRYFNRDNPVWIWLLATCYVDMTYKLTSATVASQRFWQDRQSGSLEMILATPLDVPTIVRGQWLVLRRNLLAPVVTATLLNLAIIMLLVWIYPDLRESRSWIFAAAGAYLLVSLADLVAVSWVGMWLALRVKKANSAGGYAIMFVVYPPLGVCLLTAMTGALFGVWSRWASSPYLLIGLAAGVFLFNDLLWSLWARSWLYRNFRTAATDRYQAPAAGPGWIEILTSFFNMKKTPPAGPSSIADRGEFRLTLRRKLVLGILTLLFLAGLGLWAYRVSLSREVAARLKAIQDGGAPVTVAELVQSQRGPAIEPSGTPMFLRAFAKLTPANAATTNSHLFQGKFFDSRIDPLSPEMMTAAISIVRINADSLNLIRDGAKLPAGRYPFDWNNPMVTISSSLPNVREAAQVLQIAAMLKGEEGEWPSALETVRDLFALARSLRPEPLYIPQSDRVSCLHRAVRSLERLVNLHSLTDSELAEMAKSLNEADAETLRASERTHIAERCLGLRELQLPPAAVYQRQFGGGTGFERYGAGFFLGVRNFAGLRDRDIIYYLRTYERVLKTSRLPFPKRVHEAIQIEESVAQVRGSITLMFSGSLLWSAVRPAAREAELCAHLRLAGTAVAVERYRLRHAGRMPDALDQLVPAWMVAVPFDPFDGKPLRYKKLPNGYCVYSVGNDGKDDGGLTKEKSNSGRDMVFTVERKQ